MRVLVVEDEARMAALLRQGLEEEAYAVDVVDNGPAALAQLAAYPYDLVVLDRMLPGLDGVAVCRRYRAGGGQAAILMLTARDALPDRIAGLDSGADDYLVKPFALGELLARLRALSRREGPRKRTQLQVGDLLLDTTTKRATRGDGSIELTATEYSLLEWLMRHAGQVLSRDQLIDHVWNADYAGGSKLLEVYIHYLRRKIDDPYPQKLIGTVRGLGYRIGGDAPD
ncbi:MAG: response regulator transcription factor [Chloroflexota bacterium]|nr:response regulator transcription factor [Chloroflexota bacterium]